MRSDQELIKAFADNGSEAAFAELVQRHGAAVYASALRQLSNPHGAEEVRQTVFILLSRKAATLRSNSLIIGWLMHATRYACLDYKKSNFRRIQRETAAFKMNSDETSTAEDSLELWRHVAPVLDEAVSALPEKDRNAIWMRFFQGKSLSEIGSALGCAEDAARKRLSRAVEKLHSELKRLGVTSSASALPGALFAHRQLSLSKDFLDCAVESILNPRPGLGDSATELSRSLFLAAAKSWLLPSVACLCLLLAVPQAIKGIILAPPSSSLSTTPSDYSPAGFPDASVVHGFLGKLRDNALAGKVDAVSAMCRFPLRINSPRGKIWVADPVELKARFEEIFTPEVCSILLKSRLQSLYCNKEGVAVSDGALWVAPAPGSQANPMPQVVSINLK